MEDFYEFLDSHVEITNRFRFDYELNKTLNENNIENENNK